MKKSCLRVMFMPSINLNILECKSCTSGIILTLQFCINLNILECKSTYCNKTYIVL